MKKEFKFQPQKLPIDISEKNEVLQVRLLLSQQWRMRMAGNLHLINSISQTSLVTPDFFYIETFLHL